MVLTDGPPHRVARVDAPAPGRVESRLRGEWADALRRLRPSSVVSNDEFCLADLARLRAGLGLPAVTPVGLEGYLDKVVMKSRLAEHGIDVPRFADLGLVVAGGPLPPGLGVPVVVKPRVGANSGGVRVVRSEDDWAAWTAEHAGEDGWQVEEHLDAPTAFVDALVVDGSYRPVLVGRYLGPLLPEPGVDVLGAVSVPPDDLLWRRAVDLGRRVAATLGADGRFATHLELFDTDDGLVVMEVCARAPGAMVSEMARVVAGPNLETAHLLLQAGRPAPDVGATDGHAAWLSVLARPGATPVVPVGLGSSVTAHRLPPPPVARGRHVALLVLLTSPDAALLAADVERCRAHSW
ncbi:MAG: hypothetical protein IE926_06240 [Micrococcales bacterium]|nr:hypothetical protein [Micrococcales bacterium]